MNKTLPHHNLIRPSVKLWQEHVKPTSECVVRCSKTSSVIPAVSVSGDDGSSVRILVMRGSEMKMTIMMVLKLIKDFHIYRCTK